MNEIAEIMIKEVKKDIKKDNVLSDDEKNDKIIEAEKNHFV